MAMEVIMGIRGALYLRGRDGTCQAHLVLVAIRDHPAVKRDGFVCGVQERYEFCFWDRVLF